MKQNAPFGIGRKTEAHGETQYPAERQPGDDNRRSGAREIDHGGRMYRSSVQRHVVRFIVGFRLEPISRALDL